MLMWVMSDRAIPRSLRMMQGFGVHTFRLVNAAGGSTLRQVPLEAAARHAFAGLGRGREDRGRGPGLPPPRPVGRHRGRRVSRVGTGFQIFTEEQADSFSFDVLDATKLIPEELVPLTPVGRMVLNRNPDNFFAETEQVAFCTAHVVPGIDFSNDPLLAGRHPFLRRHAAHAAWAAPTSTRSRSTRRWRRPPTTSATACTARRSTAAASPTSPTRWPAAARSRPASPASSPSRRPVQEDKVRGKPEKFADHYTQATLFYDSQTPVEQAHIAAAFRFELSKLTVPAIRERMLSSLVNVSAELAATVAAGLGMVVPMAMPRAANSPAAPEVHASPALSLTHLPGDGGVRTRKVAILVADGVVGASVAAVHAALKEAGAVPKVIAPRLGAVSHQ